MVSYNARTISSVFSFAICLVFLVSFAAAANTFKSPSTCNGQWTSCSNAFADNVNRATAGVSGTANKTGNWNGYNFSIPSSAQIDSVKIRADFYASKTSGRINVKVSGDGGATWGPSHVVGGNTAEQTFIIDVTSDLSWTPTKLSNGNFKVNATCFKVGGGSNPTCNLDWVPANVTYTPFDFSVSASPNSGSAAQGRSANTTVTVTLLSGVSQQVNLSYSGCPSGATCSFNPSSGNPTYASTFSATAGVATPTGTYPITITGTGDGKTRNAVYNFTVTDSQPVATASGNPTSGIEPLNVQFNCSASGGDAPISYFWNFGDNSNSTQQNPSHNYNAGSFNATCTVTDFDGDQSSEVVLISVDADTVPVANPSANPASGIVPLVVNFTGDFSGGNSPFSYFWDFKDGTNSTQQNPQHTFTATGFYNVSFKVTDTDGDSSTGYVLISVSDFSVSASPNSGSVVQARSVNTTVTVNLLGGNSEQVNLSQSGCPSGATCIFNPSSGNPTYASTLTISTSSSTPAGNYLITVIGTGYGTTRSADYNLTVTDSQPVATASGDPTSGIEPLNVQFNCSASSGDAPISYFWNFGDNSNSTQQNPSHNYNAGSFNATCTVTDFDGDSSTSTQISISVSADSQPVANPSANPTSGTEPLVVNFTGDFSGGNGPFTYFWNFKDGTNSTQQNPQHTFNFGSYNVSFKVTDTDGDSSTGYVLISVSQACVRADPFVEFIPSNIQSGTAGSTLNYTVNVTNTDNWACGASTFDLSSIIPVDWIGSFGLDPIVISPFQTGVSTFSLTSDVNASLGVYDFNVTATNLNATSFKGTAIGYYNVTL